ncbi:GlcNAc-PI de-N-acetylase [Candidatus Epulonipiscioides saccharophilum]|nr:GlcNAc-PI de-N-acetylase [Epulopiscium sp. SCG-B10WGA-EpuloB]
MKTIMAIGGHIGDMELTAGGVLASAALRGDKIITVALTGGERGNPKDKTVEEYRVQKIEEANKFAKELGGEAIVFKYADGELPDNEEVKWELCDLIRKYKPNVLITHWKNSMHKDHSLTHHIVNQAQFYAGLASISRELPAHWAGGPYYAENWEDPTDFKPYIYVEVTEEGYELWDRAINHHWFALNSTSYPYKEYYSHLKRIRGIDARKKYAEAFDIQEREKRIIRNTII